MNRFNGYCIGKDCDKRLWQLKYIYKKFRYVPNKKYVKPNTKYQLLEEFESPFINFSNSLFKSNKYGEAAIDKNDKKWDYVLFWNKVNILEPYFEYSVRFLPGLSCAPPYSYKFRVQYFRIIQN